MHIPVVFFQKLNDVAPFFISLHIFTPQSFVKCYAQLQAERGLNRKKRHKHWYYRYII
jgi:hypothetical protein